MRMISEQDSWLVNLPLAAVLNLNDRLHYHAKARLVAQLREDAGWVLRAARIPPCRRVRIGLVYIPPDRRRRDEDNLVATLKPIKDALVDVGVVPDDTAEFVQAEMPVIGEADREHSRVQLYITRLA